MFQAGIAWKCSVCTSAWEFSDCRVQSRKIFFAQDLHLPQLVPIARLSRNWCMESWPARMADRSSLSEML
jgi:hypothetical protein